MNTLKKSSLLSVFTAMRASGITTNLMAQTTPLPCVVMVRAENADHNEATFAAAMPAYERSHWEQAFHALADPADRGHVEALRIAREMQRFGLPLYGMQFPVRPTQLAQGAGCSGRGSWKLSMTPGTDL